MSEKGNSKLPWVIVGILAVALIGGGIYVYRDLNQSAGSTANQAAQQNTGSGSRGAMRDPAMRAATSLLRLQQDQTVALTADQKTKLIPIIQNLKNTANPSQQFSQDQANAINQVLTDAQRNFLSQRPSGQTTGGSAQWGGQRGTGQGQGTGQRQGQRQGTGNQQFNASAMYDRVLQELQK